MPTADYLDKVVCSDALELLAKLDSDSIDMCMTSPPYAMAKKGARISEEYVNIKEADYLDWILPITEQVLRVLKPTGSLFLNVDTYIEDGEMKLYVNDLLSALVRKQGYKYIQDCYYIKPPQIPSGLVSQYSRLKRCVEPVFWLAKTTKPRANAKSVLMKYSEAFESDIREVSKRHVKGGLDDKVRFTPSGHNVKLSRICTDHGGSIPVNYVYSSLADSSAPYMQAWKDQKLDVHPARYPENLVKFFTLFATNPGDIVMDPFLGGGTTAAVAKSLGRRYIGSELSPVFAKAAEIRIAMTNVHKLDADAKLEEFDSERIDSA